MIVKSQNPMIFIIFYLKKLTQFNVLMIVIMLLPRIKPIVDSLLCEQFAVSADLGDSTALDDNDAVCVLYCGQTMCNDDTRPAFLRTLQRLLHHLHYHNETQINQFTNHTFKFKSPTFGGRRKLRVDDEVIYKCC